MGPNIRVAMLISLSFIGVFAWLVHNVSRPLAAMSSRLIVTRSRPGPAASLVSRLSSRPARFQTASTFERQAREIARTLPRLALNDHSRSAGMAGAARMTLPPLSAIARRWASRAVAQPRPAPQPRQPAESVRGRDGPRLAGIGKKRGESSPAGALRHDVEQGGSSPRPDTKPERYVVRKGDSLWSIARSEWNAADETLIRRLIRANPQLHNRDEIRAGQTLFIPPKADVGEPLSVVASAKSHSVVAVAATGSTRWYIIRKDDSLVRIARRELKNPRRWPEIVKLNHALDARKPIYPGTRIKLPDT